MTSVPHRAANGRFQNPWNDATPGGLRHVARWLLYERLRHPRAADPRPHAFPVVQPRFDHEPRHGRLTITWVGHSTTLIQIGGLNLLTDPIWSDRSSPIQWLGPRRWVAPAVPFVDLPHIHAVLLSHDHYDHLDVRTVQRLTETFPSARWFTPLGVGSFVSRLGATHIVELDWWGSARHDALTLTCTPAQHFGGRGHRDRGTRLWCGWSIGAPAGNVYFAGDTALHPDFRMIGDRCGPFAVTLLPIGAYEPRWFMRRVHMNPEEAVTAFEILTESQSQSCAFIPIHWGTFKLADEPMREPPERLRRAWAVANRSPHVLSILRHGETAGF